MLYKCIFCRRFSPNLQEFDHHLRSQCDEMRAWITLMQLHAGPHPQAGGHGHEHGHNSCSLPVTPLAPNDAFWEPYRRGHPPPQAINFLEIPASSSSSQFANPGVIINLQPAAGTGQESEETITRLSLGSGSPGNEMRGERRRG